MVRSRYRFEIFGPILTVFLDTAPLLHCSITPSMLRCDTFFHQCSDDNETNRVVFALSSSSHVKRGNSSSQLHCRLFSFVYLLRTDCVRWEFAWERLNRKIMSLN
jgi:hypothetical protein